MLYIRYLFSTLNVLILGFIIWISTENLELPFYRIISIAFYGIYILAILLGIFGIFLSNKVVIIMHIVILVVFLLSQIIVSMFLWNLTSNSTVLNEATTYYWNALSSDEKFHYQKDHMCISSLTFEGNSILNCISIMAADTQTKIYYFVMRLIIIMVLEIFDFVILLRVFFPKKGQVFVV
jgi:hypothetical protein